MIQRRTRDYEVSLWSLQDSFIAVLKQYGLEYKGQIEDGKINCRDDGTETFSFSIPMYYRKNGKLVQNPAWYSVKTGALLTNMRKIKVIFNKDSDKPTVYQFLIVKVKETHGDDNSFYCDVDCEGLAFHELGKIGYKISLSAQDFYNDDYDWSTTGKWTNGKGEEITTQPLATLNYWNDKIFSTIGNWTYDIQMNWDSYSLWREEREGVVDDYVINNDIITEMKKREPNKVYEEDFIDAWALKGDEIIPTHITYAREKARVSVDIQDSNIYNITQSLAETFGVFCKYVYDHDATGHIIKRTVVYYNNFLNEQDGTMDITYPYQTNSINRSLDSTDLVTKLFVKSVDDSNTGPLSIIDVGANKSQEDYILNFDYLHSIGGITDEQYKAVDEYLLNMRKINEQLTPVSAKVIALQSQLVNLEAELTTVKNSIALATEQLLSSTALLDSITSGKEVLSILPTNPQTAVLIDDKTEGAHANSYYIKLTQKGIYAETIKLYRNYSYKDSRLTGEITTGIVEFDDYGEVIRISNLYLDEMDQSKTVYVTYDYRPSLYYERVTAMWQDRLSTDQARQENLTREINRIKYSLYGTEGVGDLIWDIDVSNLYDIDVYHKYQNLLKLKRDTIRDFNAMMGPALREGYWQPEDYTDYGDQYNERYLINLANYSEGGVDGSTGNSKFIWDEKLFEGEQDVYYEVSAAQYKQAYPCINLQNHSQVFKLMTQNPDKPISFVYKPTTSKEDDPSMRQYHTVYNNGNNVVYVIPGLYEFNENHERVPSAKYKTLKNNLSQDYKTLLEENLDNYDGQFTYAIDPPFVIDSNGETESSYVWHVNIGSESYKVTSYDQKTSTPSVITSTLSGLGIKPSDYIKIGAGSSKNSAELELVPDTVHDMDDWTFQLRAKNKKGRNPNNIATTRIKVLSSNSVTILNNDNLIQEQLVDNPNSVFQLEYIVRNSQPNNMDTNYYQWQILDDDTWNDIIAYCEGEGIDGPINFSSGNYHGNVAIRTENSNIIHKLTLDNTQNKFSNILPNPNQAKKVRLIVRTLLDMLNGTMPDVTQYTLFGRDSNPYKIDLQSGDGDIRNAVQFDSNGTNSFYFVIRTKTFTESLNQGATAKWWIGNNEVWTELNNISSNNATYKMSLDSDKAQSVAKLTITLNNETSIDTLKTAFNGKQIKYQLTTNGGTYEQVFSDSLQFVAPISVNSTEQLTSLTPAILGDMASTKTITISGINNATSITWYIIPGDGSQELNLTNSVPSGRYNIVNSNTNGKLTQSTLSIAIPAMAQADCQRDNNTKIYCKISNGSGNDVIIPKSADEDRTKAATLVVSQPLTITVDSNGYEWWAIERKESVKIGEVKFSIPISIYNKMLLNIEEKDFIEQYIQGTLIINKIIAYEPSSEERDIGFTEEQISEYIAANSGVRNITSLKSDDSVNFSGDVYFGFKSLTWLTDGNDNMINKPSTNLDKDYGIKGQIQIACGSINGSREISIVIRQNVPEFIRSDNQASNINTSKEEPEPAFKENNCIKITYMKIGTNNPINIYVQDYLKNSSYQNFSWKCGNENDEIEVLTNPLTGQIQSTTIKLQEISWQLRQNNSNNETNIPYIHSNPLSCEYAQTQSTTDTYTSQSYKFKKIGILNEGVQIPTKGNTKYRGLGYDKHLFLQVSNPWGTVYSQYFSFEQQS